MKLKELDIAANKEKQFNAKGITDVNSLLEFLPRTYNDFTKTTGFLPQDQFSCILAELRMVKCSERNVHVTTALCVEKETGSFVKVNWFNQKWLGSEIADLTGKTVFIAGKATYSPEYNNYSITQPEVFSSNIPSCMRIYPVYHKIPGMSMDYLKKKIEMALYSTTAFEDVLPEDIVKKDGFIPLSQAYQNLHCPRNNEEIQLGKERIAYNDLMHFSILNEINSRSVSKGSQYNIKSDSLEIQIRNNLPFELTPDQSTTLEEMISEAKDGKRINALIQGDVGCGKTIIAMLLAAAFIGSGYQAVIMAPTKVLAKQHYDNAVELFAPYGIEPVFIGGERMKKKERQQLTEGIANNQIKLIIGTHAVFSNDITYNNLAITITDEEHKFGVEQRAALIAKASQGVHTITMSATPIPRSLAKVIYGDNMQIYSIMSMPNGRKPVKTGIASSRERIYSFIVSQKNKGHQTYVVCPQIDISDSEVMAGVASVAELEMQYKKALQPYDVKIATLTGKNTQEETQQILDDWNSGLTDVLISTTVVEVGVNNPNATVMIISSAERFGLSQLHQLRGRVGRGDVQSYCILETEVREGLSYDRLNTLCDVHDGYKIAEEDMRMRGTGDLMGTKQSGENKYVALINAFPEIYKRTKESAKEILSRGADCCSMIEQLLAEGSELVNA